MDSDPCAGPHQSVLSRWHFWDLGPDVHRLCVSFMGLAGHIVGAWRELWWAPGEQFDYLGRGRPGLLGAIKVPVAKLSPTN